MKLKHKFLFALIAITIFSSCSGNKSERNSLPKPKNIIVFIGDGMGYNHILAANYFEHGMANAQAYEQQDWVSLAMATYSSVISISNGDTVFSGGYNPREAWENPAYIIKDYTDSGAGATAISTGEKTFNNSIGIGVWGDTLVHISSIAKNKGKSIGVVANVPFSHATPAGFLAHNSNRSNYEEITKYLLFETKADLIIGTGNPGYNCNAEVSEGDPKFVGGPKLWEKLMENQSRIEFTINDKTYAVKDATGNGKPDPWHLLQSYEEFLSLSKNPPSGRILGVPKIYSTLQSERDISDDEILPYSTPLNTNIPTLEEMAKGAISFLSQNENGFFIMIEGGAIDWASHSNNSARVIEEQIDFNNSVAAAVEWVEKYSNWDETLIIVTSDHECGYLTGPSHPEVLNSPVKNNGKGNLPSMKWNYDSHTNQLVPFYAKGAGAELFYIFADENDPIRGPFIQNSEIAQLIYLLWKQ